VHDRSTVSLKNIRRTHLNHWFKVEVFHDFLECAPTFNPAIFTPLNTAILNFLKRGDTLFVIVGKPLGGN